MCFVFRFVFFYLIAFPVHYIIHISAHFQLLFAAVSLLRGAIKFSTNWIFFVLFSEGQLLILNLDFTLLLSTAAFSQYRSQSIAYFASRGNSNVNEKNGNFDGISSVLTKKLNFKFSLCFFFSFPRLLEPFHLLH